VQTRWPGQSEHRMRLGRRSWFRASTFLCLSVADWPQLDSPGAGGRFRPLRACGVDCISGPRYRAVPRIP
jgi:hypothetical protein